MDLDLSHHSSPYINDFEVQPPSPLNSFINEPPSYNGSYNNSPYSGHSELSYNTADEGPPFGLFDDEPIGTHINDYDPSEYDPPNSSSSLLMFSDTSQDYTYETNPSIQIATFDYSSPSSNGGADSPNNNTTNRSRASSTSSNNNPLLTQTFENMTFHSPTWATQPLKPSSPPRLVMPHINAPDGDGGILGGPSLNIVPATPVSGGTGPNLPFQARLENQLRQGSSLNPNNNNQSANNASANAGPWANDGFESRRPNQQHSPSPQPYEFSNSHDGPSPSSTTHSNPGSPPPANANNSSSNMTADTSYLFSQPTRSRSKSDTSLEPPNWDVPVSYINQQMKDNVDMPHYSQQPGLTHGFTYGPPGPGAGGAVSPPPTTTNQPGSGGFLSPTLQGTSLRRSKSDSLNRLGHRQSRSEDIRQSPLLAPSSAPGHGDFLFPPNLMPMGGMTMGQTPAFLDAPSSRPLHRGHNRRASSGTRSERGFATGDFTRSHGHTQSDSWGSSGFSGLSDEGRIGGAVREGRGDGGGRNGSSRPTPYPSPHASPHSRYNELEADNMNMGMIEGMSGIPITGMGSSANMIPVSSMGQEIVVSKPTVTTGRTANASHRRRKQEANFVCPVPGCGSTFTRSFNLKGHIRSHNEEKPFQCHWPGCGKGFARQHDCKRHEQLHTNYRPFSCDGCGKMFARMDALNRHLRSEGGADCARLQEASGPETTPPSHAGSSPPDGRLEQLPVPLVNQSSGGGSQRTKVEGDGWSGVSL